MNKVVVKTVLRKYPIFIEKGIITEAHSLIKANLKDQGKLLLVTNKTIYGIYEKEIKDLCQSIGTEYDIICLEDGEEHKSLDSAKTIYSRLIELNFHRNDAIIAFGGGVIGDTAGYIAATFYRGIKLVHIPTTIIAQVDSSIGGKVVVNFEGKKNIIGSFYQPHMVIIDPTLLESLDEKQVKNGLGEIVKYGLVFDRNIIKTLAGLSFREDYNVGDLVRYDDFESIILKCAKIKAKVVEKDEFDIRYRNLLNFGHTIGHSIENVSGLKEINHGQAVTMGMVVALEISIMKGDFPEEQKKEIKLFLKRLGLPYKIPDIDVEKVVEGLRYDKKFTSKNNRFILLKKINRPFISDGISREVIIDSINNCINK